MHRDLHLKEYQANSVGTADQKQLIVMLYEGAIRFIQTAETNMASFKTYDKANANILRAQDILTELMVSLNIEQGGEIAQNLFNLYAYAKTQLLEANVQKKAELLKPVKKIITELLEAWKQIEMPSAAKAAAAKPTEHKGGFKAEGWTMLEQLLAVNAMILRAASNTNLSTKMLAQRLNLLNAKRMRIVEHGNNSAPAKAADKTRIELIHYFGQLAEAKIRSRI